MTTSQTPAWLDTHLDAILRASGSALKHFTLEKPKADMRAALLAAIAASPSPELPAERARLVEEAKRLYREAMDNRAVWASMPSPESDSEVNEDAAAHLRTSDIAICSADRMLDQLAALPAPTPQGESAMTPKRALDCLAAALRLAEVLPGDQSDVLYHFNQQIGSPALAAAPTPASVQPLREPKPDDLLTVANIVQDGTTLTLEINQLGDLVHLIGEDEATYQLHVTTMTRANFDDLGEFDGF